MARRVEQHHPARPERARVERRPARDGDDAGVVGVRAEVADRRHQPREREVGRQLLRERGEPVRVGRPGGEHVGAEAQRVLERVEPLDHHQPAVPAGRGEQLPHVVHRRSVGCPPMLAAIGWGALAASSLVLGALLALGRRWPDRMVGLVLSFGAGALISAVSFELAEEGAQVGGALPLALGLAAGALTYFLADRPLERKPDAGGGSLALGAFLDGIPEQAVLGIGLATGEGVSVGLLVAVFVSNLPESIGASADMLEAGKTRRTILRLWLAVSLICALATVVRVRDRRRGERRAQGRDRRLRGGRAARDARRLDDPRGAAQVRPRRRARARARLRGRGGAVGALVTHRPRASLAFAREWARRSARCCRRPSAWRSAHCRSSRSC